MLKYPIDNVGSEPLYYNPQVSIYVSQNFNGHWYLKTPTVYNGKLWPKGTEFNSIFGLLGHNGRDIAAPAGTPYKWPFDETGYIIEQTKKETGYGYRLCVRFERDNRNFIWLAGHSQEFITKDLSGKVLELDWNFNCKDYPVKTGQILGLVGSTGFSTGAHLHEGAYEYNSVGNKLNENNGFGGAIDPATLYTMPNKLIETQELNGELRIILKAPSMEKWEALCEVYGLDSTKITEHVVKK